MILVVTNKEDYTADFLILQMKRQGINFVRLNTEDFPTRITVHLPINATIANEAPHFVIYGKKVFFDQITGVWYRRPHPPIPSQEIEEQYALEFIVAESRHLLDAVWRILDCTWVSHPDYIRIAESKPFQLVVAQEIGFKIPNTLIATEKETILQFLKEHHEIVYKPMRYGYIVREPEDTIGLIYTNLVTSQDIDKLDAVHYAPNLFQRWIQKRSELRVTVVGNRAFAVELDSQKNLKAKIDWRRAKTSDLPHHEYDLPEDIEAMCLGLVERLNLNFGAIDLIRTPDDEYYFLEINPNGQWAWIEQMLPHIRISDALLDLLSARVTK